MDLLIQLIIWIIKKINAPDPKAQMRDAQAKAQEEAARWKAAQANVRQGAPINPGYAVRMPDVLLPPSIKRPGSARAQPVRLRAGPSATPLQRAISAVKKNAATAAPPPNFAALNTGVKAAPPAPPSPIMQPAAARQTAANSQFANATTLARWLRPEILRQQFMLTEILGRPVGLRDQSSDPWG